MSKSNDNIVADTLPGEAVTHSFILQTKVFGWANLDVTLKPNVDRIAFSRAFNLGMLHFERFDTCEFGRIFLDGKPVGFFEHNDCSLEPTPTEGWEFGRCENGDTYEIAPSGNIHW